MSKTRKIELVSEDELIEMGIIIEQQIVDQVWLSEDLYINEEKMEMLLRLSYEFLDEIDKKDYEEFGLEKTELMWKKKKLIREKK